MSQQSRLDVFLLQRFLQQRVLFEVQHAETKVQSSIKIRVCLQELFLAERLILDGRAGFSEGRPYLLLVGQTVDWRLFGGSHCEVQCSGEELQREGCEVMLMKGREERMETREE